MKLFLIRHGQTEGNARRVLQTPELPLSAAGREEALRLARRLAPAGIARVLSSDLRRARMTAEAIAAACGAPVDLEPALQERNFGALRGTAYAELRRLGIDPFAPDYQPPEGESWVSFHARVDGAWQQVGRAAARAGGNLAVVTHGLVCASLARRHLQLAPGAQAPEAFDNTSVTRVDAAPPFAVELLNCTAHLARGSRP